MAIGLALPLLADDGARQTLSASQTARFHADPAGTIRLENSYGEVDIDGWDNPEVEVSVVRSSAHDYGAEDRAAAQARVDAVQIAARQEGNDVIIATTYPPRRALLYPFSRRSDVEIRYSVHAPRAAKVIVEARRGGVNVSGMSGDIRASVTNGQITLALAPGQYSIDAESKIGRVYSDFEGRGRRRHLIGEELIGQSPTPAPHLHLRVRLGDIVILKQTALPAAD
jgi:hypothetical protein